MSHRPAPPEAGPKFSFVSDGVETRLESDLDEAQYLLNQLYAAGVDYEDVVATLERDGINKFVASFTELLQGIADKRRQLAAA